MGLVKGVQSEEDGIDLGDDNRPAFEPEEDEEIVIEEEGENDNFAVEPEEGTTPAPAAPAEEKPAYTFKTKEELDAYIKSQTKPATPPEKVEPKQDDDELEKLEFWKGYRNEKGEWVGEAPEDWNDFARTIIKHLDPKKTAPKILDEIRNMTKQEQSEIEAINAEFDAEFDELAAQGLVPKRGTKEGDEVNAQISIIGSKYGQTSIKSAYELWKDLPKEKGGGAGVAPVKKVNPSKQVSRLIRSSRATQTATPANKRIPYAKLHAARGVDELLDD